MKLQIRRGTFETNSSATHSLSIYNTDRWNQFKNGELYIDQYNDCFRDGAELQEMYDAAVDDKESYPIEDWMLDEGIRTWADFDNLYEVLEEDIEDAGVTAVSIYGWE